MTDPTDPIAAVMHPDPYPWYARLVAERPVYRDDERGHWVVSSAEAVAAVLSDPNCRVRPAGEPIPVALAGSPAGEIFARLVRMSDGDRHRAIKPAVAGTLASVSPGEVERLSRDWANRLVADSGPAAIVDDLSAHVIGSLLGIPAGQLPQLAGWMRDFVPCFSPISSPDQIEQGQQAASELLASGRTATSRAGLFRTLANELEHANWHDWDAVIANGIGFLWQAHEATAGLIGNTLLALARHPQLTERLTDDPALLERVILEVLRADPPIQNTRRYVAAETAIAGQPMQAGDTILVVLAAANRDPAANPNPNAFDPDRQHRCSFTFGSGPHSCPGSILAITIAQAGVEALLAAGVSPAEPVCYRPSVNARIPIVRVESAEC